MRVMGELGRGLSRMWAVTIRKNGFVELGSSIGEDVDSDMPIFTAGFADLHRLGQSFLTVDKLQETRTAEKDDHLHDLSFCLIDREI